MFEFLKKAYPFNDDLRSNSKIIFFISLGVLAFLIIFQPIEISAFSKQEIFYLVTGLAASTFLILTLNLIILPSLFPNQFQNDRWNIKKEIFWNIWMLLTIATSNLLFYSKLFGVLSFSFSDILKIILMAVLPVAVLIIINHDRLMRSHLQSARQLNKKLLENKELKEKLVNLRSAYKKDTLILKSDSIVLIKSSDNYIEVYYKTDGILKKQLVRSSLKSAEESIRDFPFMFKCHRTFIVNINHIKEIEGNSQGYKIYFHHLDFPALVSQKYINEFKKRI